MTQTQIAQDAAIRMMGDAARWQFCLQYGFPAKSQHPSLPAAPHLGRPHALFAWTAYGPDVVRGSGHSAQEALDDAMRQAGVIK